MATKGTATTGMVTKVTLTYLVKVVFAAQARHLAINWKAAKNRDSRSYSVRNPLDLEGLPPMMCMARHILKCVKIALVKQKPSGLENTWLLFL